MVIRTPHPEPGTKERRKGSLTFIHRAYLMKHFSKKSSQCALMWIRIRGKTSMIWLVLLLSFQGMILNISEIPRFHCAISIPTLRRSVTTAVPCSPPWDLLLQTSITSDSLKDRWSQHTWLPDMTVQNSAGWRLWNSVCSFTPRLLLQGPNYISHCSRYQVQSSAQYRRNPCRQGVYISRQRDGWQVTSTRRTLNV